jgi:hydroxymethylpyrimidine pyrophosphatase-like HAD family hydrolase
MDALYVDLDGTLLGPGGTLLSNAEGAFTLLGVRAIEACARGGAEVVMMSGRGRRSLSEDARLLGQSSYIFEAGACVMLEDEEHWLTGDLQPREGPGGSIHDQIEAGGGPALLLERYPGRLEHHEPWHLNREVSHLFRGLVDAEEATQVLADAGHANLRLLDNGVVHRRSPVLDGLEQVRVYHLLPRTVSKAAGVAFHQRARGFDPQRCLGVGDSREDLACAAQLGAFWLVANAVQRDPSIREAIAGQANVRVAEAGHGDGVYEAVVTELATGR